MAHKDELAWRGSPMVRRSGGFVDGVAMNEPTHALAVDPDGVVGPDGPGPRGPGGPSLDLERIDSGGASPVQRNGRVRLTRT
ncbi:MAG: hypothetical protein H6737_15915 [Alphaproteobacteria bacterium]|nr:hypothetical protein [Alphaproteobacteria bacterium]